MNTNVRQTRTPSRASILVSLTLSSVLVACSATPGPPPGLRINIPDSASMAVISKGVDKDLEARFNRDSTIKGANVGAGSGAAAGAAAALTCGPFFFLCALGTIPAGAVVGAAAGAAGGAAVDATKKPSVEDLEKLEALLVGIAEARTLHEEIRAATEAQVDPARRAPGKQADALMEVSLGDIRFTRYSSGDYGWLMKVNVAAQWNRNYGKRRGGTEHFTVYSPREPLSHWIDQDGSAIGSALDDLVVEASEVIEFNLF